MPLELLSFIVATVLILVVPGPDFVLVTRNTLVQGKRAGFATMAGILAGLLGHTTLSVFGLSALIAANAHALSVLKLAGATYLSALGILSLRGTSHADHEATAVPSRETGAAPGGSPFVQGALNNILNPKALIFFLSFLPQFINPDAPALPQTTLLGTTTIVLAALWWTAFITAMGSGLQLLHRRAVRAVIDKLSGIVLIGLGARLFTARL